ncbi:MAG TPA: response regulator [Solirubrobacteraceae bacterium]
MAFSVLVVDDDPTFVTLAARVLAEIGAEVVATAEEPPQALAAAHATMPDGALVDVGLPGKEGIDLAYRLATLPWQPRVVLVSADGDAGCAVEADAREPKLAFLPKDQLANGGLRRVLMSP